MQAPEIFDLEATRSRVHGTCLIGGCTCKDPRIVSRRRAAFFAAIAIRSGQTAQRVIAAEAEWRIPLAPLTAEASVVDEEPVHGDPHADVIHAPAYAHEPESER